MLECREYGNVIWGIFGKTDQRPLAPKITTYVKLFT